MPRVSPLPAAGGSRVSPRPSRDEPNVPEPECSRTSVLRLLPSESARAVPDGLIEPRPWLGRPLPKRGAVGPLRQETRKWPKEREQRGPRGCRDRDRPAGGAGKMAAARRGELGRVGASGLAAAGAAFPCGTIRFPSSVRTRGCATISTRARQLRHPIEKRGLAWVAGVLRPEELARARAPGPGQGGCGAALERLSGTRSPTALVPRVAFVKTRGQDGRGVSVALEPSPKKPRVPLPPPSCVRDSPPRGGRDRPKQSVGRPAAGPLSAVCGCSQSSQTRALKCQTFERVLWKLGALF